MALNPMSFVTPYTAVGSGGRGGGQSFANSMQGAKQQQISRGYLDLQQKQQSFSQEKFAQKELDEAHQQLLKAFSTGNQDEIEAAANNMRVIGARHGVTIDEVRSDRAAANVAGQTGKANAALAEVGSEENPLDVDAYDAAQAKAPVGSAGNPLDVDAFDADQKARAFTGGIRTPGGSLPAQVGGAVTRAEMRPPGGTLPRPASAAEPEGTSEAPLRGYTVRGPDGKTIYQASPQDIVNGQRQRVASVFDGLPADVADAGSVAEAKKIATGLVGVLTPQQAVMKGLEHLEQGQQRRGALQITEANRKPRFGGGGAGGFQAMGRKQDTAESIQSYIKTSGARMGKLNDSDRLLSQAEALISSPDPALQRNAIDVLVQSRSGATVSDRERSRYDQLEGVMAQAKNLIARWTGGPLDPAYVQSIKQVIQEQRRINQSTREEDAMDLEEAYEAQNEGKVDAPILERRKKALGKTLRRGDTEAPPDDDPAAGLY